MIIRELEFLKYQIINNANHLNEYVDVDEGIENRIKKVINDSNNWDELVNNIKTKRYTMSRVRRAIYNLFLDISSL